MTASTTQRTIGIGIQDFEKIRKNNNFYIDKTHFIKEWWESNDDVTLITRPRRFGKTLLMNTVDRFLSNQYEGQTSLFEGLKIWEEEKYRQLQGTVPVIFISFAEVKAGTYEDAVDQLMDVIAELYDNYRFLLETGVLSPREERLLRSTCDEMEPRLIKSSLHNLCRFLYKYYGKKAIILLDEYDTPMQEAYVHGYWDKIVALFRPFFGATFKTNDCLHRALMTGITRVSRESIFSDLNNLKIVSTTSKAYSDAMGFTEEEVFAALNGYGYTDRAAVKHWYDGFTFGSTPNIYNPWSILNYLQEGELQTYWANTSSNSLAGKLIREGDADLKSDFETLLRGGSIEAEIDEQIVYGEMGDDPDAIWSLLLASGYLKVVQVNGDNYELALTNYEVQKMFRGMVRGWFNRARGNYNGFSKALVAGDVEAMNAYLNRLSESVFSSFDTGTDPSKREPERFYHGLVLGLIVELEDRYIITSNRESGFGRYDVMLEPRDISKGDGIIMEFKVNSSKTEKTLEDTVAAAHKQIEVKCYAQRLVDLGLPEDRIHKYGFAFAGKRVLIG